MSTNSPTVVACTCTVVGTVVDGHPIVLVEAASAAPPLPPMPSVKPPALTSTDGARWTALPWSPFKPAAPAATVLSHAAADVPAGIAVYSARGALISQNRFSEALFGTVHALDDWFPTPAAVTSGTSDSGSLATTADPGAPAATDGRRRFSFRGELVVPTLAGLASHWVDLALRTDLDGDGGGVLVAFHVPLSTIDTVRVLHIAKVRAPPPPPSRRFYLFFFLGGEGRDPC